MRERPDTRHGTLPPKDIEQEMRSALAGARVRSAVIVMLPGPLGYELYELYGEQAEVARVACGLPPLGTKPGAFITWEEVARVSGP